MVNNNEGQSGARGTGSQTFFEHKVWSPGWLWAAVGLILAGYLSAALLFALNTPAWQAPDEPAHYNYVAHIASGQGLPILDVGDYDQAYLRALVENRFPPSHPIEPIQYESHQPPLYYISAAPVYWLADGRLIFLRLYNVLLGAGVLLLIFLIVHTIFPDRPTISLGSMALAAFLPMHVAMMAAVNNDALAELLIAATVLALVRWMRAQDRGQAHPRHLLTVGGLMGLALVTKSTTYILLPLVLLTILGVCRKRLNAQDAQALATNLLLALLPALVIAAPLWLRNMTLYGGLDFLGLKWHDAVVLGQPRTAEWIALNGLGAYWDRAVDFTFKSFWGVFGWMGIFMDGRVYLALTIFTGVLFLGGLWAAIRMVLGWPDSELDRFQLQSVAVLALLSLGALAGYVWYNLGFVQHQGRYLFPGLSGIAFFMALAWREVLRPAQGAVTGLLVGVLTLAVGAVGWLTGNLDKWLLLFTGLTGVLLLVQSAAGTLVQRAQVDSGLGQLIHRPWVRWPLTAVSSVAWLTPFLLLYLLDLAIPFAYVLTQVGGVNG